MLQAKQKQMIVRSANFFEPMDSEGSIIALYNRLYAMFHINVSRIHS